MKNRLTLTILLVIGFASNLFATAQSPDKIIYNQTEYNLQINPLEQYFLKNPNKRPKPSIHSSSLWRGYIATFEIRQNELFLIDIKIQTLEKDNQDNYVWKSVVSEIFPDFKSKKLEWFEGLLILPFGKLINYVHLDYGSTFENYVLLNLKSGTLIKERKLSGEEFEFFKKAKFSLYQKTKEYEDEKSKLVAENWKQREIDYFLGSFIESYIMINED